MSGRNTFPRYSLSVPRKGADATVDELSCHRIRVLAGNVVVSDEVVRKDCFWLAKYKRGQLQRDGVLVRWGNGLLLTKDTELDNLAIAHDFVTGYHGTKKRWRRDADDSLRETRKTRLNRWQLRQLLTRKPFQTFSIELVDGSQHDVTAPDGILPGYPDFEFVCEFALRLRYGSLEIIRIEDVQGFSEMSHADA